MTVEAQAAAPAVAPAAAPAAPVATVVPTQAPAATPAAAPAAAPATPESSLPTKQEPAAKPDEKPQFGEKAITYNPTGNQHLDLAVNFFGKLGLDLETLPGYAEAGNGDFSIIRAHLATLGIPGADAYVALAETGLKALNDAQAETTKATQAMILEAEGGDGTQWAEALEWLRGQTEDAEGLQQREELNGALAKGGLMAKLAVDFILGQYRSQPGVSTPQRKGAVSEQAGATQGSGAYALSQRDYQAAVDKLRRENPGQELEGSNELNALRQRRQAGMRAGK